MLKVGTQITAARIDRLLDHKVHKRAGYELALRNMKDRPLARWMAKWLWRGLENLGALDKAYVDIPVYTYQYTEKQQQSVTEAVMEAVYAADLSLREDWSKYAILMGSDDFFELSGEAQREDFGMFTVTCDDINIGYASGYRTVYRDFPVHVVPHIKGVVCVPKVLIEKKVRA